MVINKNKENSDLTAEKPSFTMKVVLEGYAKII